jgi:dethiobiotin synthase
VTGTDTGVGKTVVSAALLWKHRALAPRYWKPVQTGIEQDDDTAEVRRLGGYAPESVLEAGVRLPRPLSPHRAAELAGTSIDVGAIVQTAAAEAASASGWIVEGAGGILVPLNARDLMADLMSRLALPVLVVSRSTLGTINHTLLTLEALRSRALAPAGVVMVGPPDAANRRAIEHYGRIDVVGELPPLDPLTPEALRRWADTSLDTRGWLTPLL